MKKQTSKSDPRQDELLKAYDRICNTPADVMRWLIKFAGEDRTSLSSGDRINRDYELVAFLRFGPRAGWSDPPFYTVSPWMDLPPGWGNLLSPVFVPSEKEILDLQQRTRNFLGKMVAHQAIDLHARVKDFQVKPCIQLVEHGKDPTKDELLNRGCFVPSFDTHIDAFLYLLGHMLAANMGRVKNCPECQTMFLQDRRNQKYCSVSCQSRVATRKYLGIPEERKGKRGRPPKKKTLEKLGKDETQSRPFKRR